MNFSEIDILVGGMLPNTTFLSVFSMSKSYIHDDLMWCLPKSKNYPMIINVFLSVAPECWFILVFGIGYLAGLIIYIMVQFDLEYKNRNKIDFHYAIFLIILPGIVGISQRFKPKFIPLRMFYGFILIIMLFVWQVIFFKGIRFIKIPVQRPQISTTDELTENQFDLTGSNEVLDLITFDGRVRFFLGFVEADN